MKPDWKDAPDWANYLAQDDNGSWSWFEHEPEWQDDMWVPQIGMAEEVDQPNGEITLERRP